MLTILKWLPLHYQTTCLNFIMLYKILHNIFYIGFSNYFTYRNVRTLRGTHQLQLLYKHSKRDKCKNSFFYKLICDWNALPEKVASMPTLNGFMFKKNNTVCNICINFLMWCLIGTNKNCQC